MGATTRPGYPAVDLEILGRLQATLNWSALLKLIHDYINDQQALLGQMHEALDIKDAATLRRHAHTLKSTSALLGATGLSKWCEDLETEVRTGDLSRARDLLAEIDVDGRRVQEELEAFSRRL